SPYLPGMFPIQKLESQTRVRPGLSHCCWPVVDTFGIDPAHGRRIPFARQKRGNESSIVSQRVRNRTQPTFDQVQSAMTKDRLGHSEIERDARLSNYFWRIRKKECWALYL